MCAVCVFCVCFFWGVCVCVFVCFFCVILCFFCDFFVLSLRALLSFSGGGCQVVFFVLLGKETPYLCVPLLLSKSFTVSPPYSVGLKALSEVNGGRRLQEMSTLCLLPTTGPG